MYVETTFRALAADYLMYRWTKHGITTTYTSVDLAHYEIFRAKVGKGGGIKIYKPFFTTMQCKPRCILLMLLK